MYLSRKIYAVISLLPSLRRPARAQPERRGGLRGGAAQPDRPPKIPPNNRAPCSLLFFPWACILKACCASHGHRPARRPDASCRHDLALPTRHLPSFPNTAHGRVLPSHSRAIQTPGAANTLDRREAGPISVANRDSPPAPASPSHPSATTSEGGRHRGDGYEPARPEPLSSIDL